MLIIPAIDLQDGTCVRLKQGQFDQVTRFHDHPVERAAFFNKAGAKRLHVVDLDGAQSGSMRQLDLICSMQQSGISIQAGGGIRSLEQARMCINAGITRLVLGSIAISNHELTMQIIQEIKPEHIVLAFDIRIIDTIPIPAIHGWQENSSTTLWEVVSFYQQLGITELLCTDIACDGMMNGPNFKLYQQAVELFPKIRWQASGGIRDLSDIKALDSLGVSAVILGLTLYQEHFDLNECLVALQEEC